MSFKIIFLHVLCLFQIRQYEKVDNAEDRLKMAREIYDNFIMKELLSRSHVSNFLLLHWIVFWRKPSGLLIRLITPYLFFLSYHYHWNMKVRNSTTRAKQWFGNGPCSWYEPVCYKSIQFVERTKFN